METEKLWTCGRSSEVALWDFSKGEQALIQKYSLGDYLGFSQCDLLNENDRHLLVSPGPSQNMFSIWDINSNYKVCTIESEDSVNCGSIMQVKWIKTSTSTFVLALYENGDVCLWDWCNKKILSKIELKENPLCITFNPTLNKGICGSTSDKLSCFSLDSENNLNFTTQISITNPGISCISSRRDEKIFATGGWDYRIRIFTLKKFKPLAVLSYHKKSVECIQFSNFPVSSMSDGILLAAGSSDCTVSLWNIFN